MEEKKETDIQNNGGGIEAQTIEAQTEDTTPAADNVVDDDIQYTFVVPKGEIYRDPDLEPSGTELSAVSEGEVPEEAIPEEETIPEPVVIEPEPAEAVEGESESAETDDENPEPDRTIVADRRQFAVEPPVYAETGLPDDDITYTFVVPKGEVYTEPDPEEERKAKEAERFRRAILSEETKVMERQHPEGEDAEKTQYGLPAGHTEMGELAKKQKARRLYKKRKKNRLITRFYIALTVIFLAIGWYLLSNSGLFTIDAIVVQGNSHYTAEEIINMGHASPGRNIIYKANIKETREFLENNPYIKRAEVKRRLPSTLVIRVTEREEHLAFKYDDDYLVMDEDGILLKKSRNKPMTTIVQGIVVSKIKLGEKIGTENNKRMDMVLDLIKMMMKSDLYYVSVDISSEKKVKAYIYDTLVVKADYDTLMTNMENGRLHLVLEKLFGDGIERGTITFGEDGTASFVPTF